MAGKKKKKKPTKRAGGGEEVVTTQRIVRERERATCPRLGDAAIRSERARAILHECVETKLNRSSATADDAIDLSRSCLASVPEQLDSCRAAEIDLSRNELFGDGRAIFAKCSDRLVRLRLTDNYLQGPLADPPLLLEELLLDRNQITELPKVNFGRRLKRFSISRNALKELPEYLEEWHEIVYFNARNNHIKNVPIGEWQCAETLYLGGNELDSLSENVGKLTALTELDLRSNNLAELPDSLASCTRLKHLHLGNNKISRVQPEILAALVEVEELHLYKNKLDVLPPEIGCLGKCHRLTLSSTNIRTLPETISSCKSLQELYINNCAKFNSVPDSAGMLSNLEEVQAKKCPSLKALPSTGVGWQALRQLDLRAAKKQVCKVPPELLAVLDANNCAVRGGVQKRKSKKKN